MAEIINLNEVRDQQEEVFAIREENGELKPMEDWTGEDWEKLFRGPMTSMAEMTGVSAWEMFANFMSGVLSDSLPEIEE